METVGLKHIRMIDRDRQLIIGIDGGGTKTLAILFDNTGMTIDELECQGSNLYVYGEEGVKRIITLIKGLLEKNKLSFDDVSSYGIGVAGISDLNQREALLKELDRENISQKTLILSDAESAFKILCPSNKGILVNIGTGIICYGRDDSGKTFKTAGLGHDKGDVGSGYWLGKELFSRLVLNEALVEIDKDIEEIFLASKKMFKVENIKKLFALFEEEEDIYMNLSIIAKITLDLAKKGNDIALSIVQEGTRFVGEYIISLADTLNYSNSNLLLAANGSVIKDEFYRKLLNDSLQFDFKNINWVISDLSPAYGAGLLSAQFNNISISVKDIINNRN